MVPLVEVFSVPLLNLGLLLGAFVLLLGGGRLVLLRTQFLSTNRMRPAPFLVAGLLYLIFIAVVTYHGVSAGG